MFTKRKQPVHLEYAFARLQNLAARRECAFASLQNLAARLEYAFAGLQNLAARREYAFASLQNLAARGGENASVFPCPRPMRALTSKRKRDTNAL